MKRMAQGVVVSTILSLFDYSGEWSRPYREAGYRIIVVDLQHGLDVFEIDETLLPPIHGILAAPPCTDFAASGARWWSGKDARGETEYSVALVNRTLDIIEYLFPSWWALENPVGRIARLVPRLTSSPAMWFQPHWYGDPYTKRTGLWGDFNTELPLNYVEPVLYESSGKRSSHLWRFLGGKSVKTKNERSKTPAGFAKAFFLANP